MKRRGRLSVPPLLHPRAPISFGLYIRVLIPTVQNIPLLKKKKIFAVDKPLTSFTCHISLIRKPGLRADDWLSYHGSGLLMASPILCPLGLPCIQLCQAKGWENISDIRHNSWEGLEE